MMEIQRTLQEHYTYIVNVIIALCLHTKTSMAAYLSTFHSCKTCRSLFCSGRSGCRHLTRRSLWRTTEGCRNGHVPNVTADVYPTGSPSANRILSWKVENSMWKKLTCSNIDLNVSWILLPQRSVTLVTRLLTKTCAQISALARST